jgi:hypothetical protein
MSPVEYARLQGFERPLPLDAANKMMSAFGDAVCVPVISWIDHHLLSGVRHAHAALGVRRVTGDGSPSNLAGVVGSSVGPDHWRRSLRP